jgi:fructose-1,6-bisphosphatase/inositol monophosphatase family enzyme
MEPMVDGVILELCNISSDVDHSHTVNATGHQRAGGFGYGRAMNTSASSVLEVLQEVVAAVAASLDGLADWGLAGTKHGQYRSDLVADEAALDILDRAGYGVLSEESGLHNPSREIMVVIDPVDGSTNASRGIPWWATSVCALDDSGPLAAVVVNQATRTCFEAIRGGGALRDGLPIHPTDCQSMRSAIVAISGYPAHWLGWSQYRSFGAAALDMCAVASGQLDAFIDCAYRSLAPWDYLGGLLVCAEAGAVVSEAFGRELVVREPSERRTVVAAATPALLGEAVTARGTLGNK